MSAQPPNAPWPPPNAPPGAPWTAGPQGPHLPYAPPVPDPAAEKKRNAVATVGGLVAVGLSFLFMFTYSGPFRWLAELQLRWMGSYSEKLTLVFTALLLMAVGALVWLPIRRAMAANRQSGRFPFPAPGAGAGYGYPHATAPAAAGAPPSAAPAAPDQVAGSRWGAWGVLALGVIFACIGGYKQYQARTSGALSDVSVSDLVAGRQAPRWVRLSGVAVPELSVTFGKRGSEKTYVPLAPAEAIRPTTQAGEVEIAGGFVAFAEVGKKEGTVSGAGPFQGTLSSGGLPGPVRSEYERAGFAPAAKYWVLDLGNDPGKDRRAGNFFLLFGAGALALGCILLAVAAAKARRATR